MITTHEILPSYPRWRHGGSVRAFVGGEVTLFFVFFLVFSSNYGRKKDTNTCGGRSASQVGGGHIAKSRGRRARVDQGSQMLLNNAC